MALTDFDSLKVKLYDFQPLGNSCFKSKDNELNTTEMYIQTDCMYNSKDKNKINQLLSRLYLVLSSVENSKDNLVLAELHAAKLTQNAPSDYLGWTLLAQSKIYKDNYTWEDQSALTKALTLAPFERKNQIRLLPLVIENWLLLSNKNQELTLELIGSALNDPSTDHIAAGYMREFNNIIPFNPLIDNSPLSGRIRRMLKQ